MESILTEANWRRKKERWLNLRLIDHWFEGSQIRPRKEYLIPSDNIIVHVFHFNLAVYTNLISLAGTSATGNSRSETGKSSRHAVPKIPKIPVPKILQNKPQSNFQKCRIPLVLQVFRRFFCRTSKFKRQLFFYNRTNHKQAKKRSIVLLLSY